MPEKRRRESDRFLQAVKNIDTSETHYSDAAYLDGIDEFDYSFFGLFPKEARLMDPNQRLFLQTAWSAIETAGYAAGKIKGTKTGEYLGFHSNLSGKYAQLVADAEPDSLSMALTGNVARDHSEPHCLPARF